jgi:NhaP-type Na+/H+ or K+/H+ antiporter
VTWGDVAVITVLILAWSSFASVADRWSITEPMVFAGAGVVLEGLPGFHMTVTSSMIQTVAELALALILFSDAARVRVSSLRRQAGIPARLLGVGLPLTVILGAVVANLLFGGSSLWLVVLISACLAPTDAGLGAGIVTNPMVPVRVRQSLNVESGLNDGIASPLVPLAIAGVLGAIDHTHHAVIDAVGEILLGVAIGIVAGLLAGYLLRLAIRRNWTDQSSASVAMAATAIGTYAVSISLGGNGFVAAFIGGLTFGVFESQVGPDVAGAPDALSQLLSCFIWFSFGAVMLHPTLVHGNLEKPVIYGVASLTVIRMVPVAIALVGTRLGLATDMFIGWFGPRGMASVCFALIAIDQLGPSEPVILPVVSMTVALSILAHGISTNPLIAAYGRHMANTATASDVDGEDGEAAKPARWTFASRRASRLT